MKSKKKKICFVNINAYSLFNPDSNAPIGGTEVQLFTLANCLKKYFDTSFIVGNWGQKKMSIMMVLRCIGLLA